MSVDIDGGMIVGCVGSDLTLPDDAGYDNIIDWLAEENGMEYMAPYFDAEPNDCIFGFTVEDHATDDLDVFCAKIMSSAEEFESITGVKPAIIGCQSVW